MDSVPGPSPDMMAGGDMEYRIKSVPTGTEIVLTGRMTFADHDKFRGLISVFDGADGQRMVLDLGGLDFVDSSGLGMFIIARDIAHKRNLDFALRGAHDEVRRLISAAKLDKMLNVID